MKIAVFVHNLTGGGAERVAALWMKGLCEQGHDVYAILNDKYSPRTYEVPKSVKIYDNDLPFKNRYCRFLFTLLCPKYAVKKLRNALNKIQPDVVINVIVENGPILFEAKGALNFKVIGTDHNAYERPDYAPLTDYQHWLKFTFNNKFDCVTVLTQADKDFIRDRVKNVFVLPNPLTFKPLKVVPKKKKIVLASGRLDVWKVKGFDLLIEAWGKITHSHPDWELHIAGTGKKKNIKFLESLIAQTNTPNSIKLLGYKENIVEAYKDASIFVLSSRYEGFGMVLTEAMSQGCACIACDYKGRQREIIRSDEEGIICQPDDSNAIAAALEKMIIERSYRSRVQVQAIKRSNDFRLNKIMEKWIEIFDYLA